jgi:hypothetical protein
MTVSGQRFSVHNADSVFARAKIQNEAALPDVSPAYVPACHPEGKLREKSVCYVAAEVFHTAGSDKRGMF